MIRSRTLYAIRYAPVVATEAHDARHDDPQEVAGDPYAELEVSDCPNDPHGHLFFGWFSKRRCVKCGAFG